MLAEYSCGRAETKKSQRSVLLRIVAVFDLYRILPFDEANRKLSVFVQAVVIPLVGRLANRFRGSEQSSLSAEEAAALWGDECVKTEYAEASRQGTGHEDQQFLLKNCSCFSTWIGKIRDQAIERSGQGFLSDRPPSHLPLSDSHHL